MDKETLRQFGEAIKRIEELEEFIRELYNEALDQSYDVAQGHIRLCAKKAEVLLEKGKK